MSDDDPPTETVTDETRTLAGIQMGQTVYDEDGKELGTIRGRDESGFYVTVTGEAGGGDVTLMESREVFGEGYVMWRCWECGEMGEIDDGDLPEACPNCDAPREELYYWIED